MKSVKQQYIALREGNLSKPNFMRNVRAALPHLVTNITSFDDTVKILRNKDILTEADIKEGYTYNTTGKDVAVSLTAMAKTDPIISGITWPVPLTIADVLLAGNRTASMVLERT